MTALIFTAPSPLRAPLPNTPKLPDLDSGILWTIDPADLVGTIADGGTVTSFIAPGADTAANRTFDFKYTNWDFPTLSHAGGPGGAPAIEFNGTQQICNNAGTTPLSQPITYLIVCNSTEFASSQARVVSSGGLIVAPDDTGYYASNVAQSRIFGGAAPTDYTSVIVVFDGANSKIKVGDGEVVVGLTGDGQTGRTCIGGNGTTLTSVGLNGGIAFLRQYGRAFTDTDIAAARTYLARRFSLSA